MVFVTGNRKIGCFLSLKTGGLRILWSRMHTYDNFYYYDNILKLGSDQARTYN